MSDSGFSPTDVEGLGLGLLFGDDSLFSSGFREVVKTVGVTHLVAASGANLRFVLGWPGWLGQRFSWWLWHGVSAGLIWWYWQIAQQSGSLWRASGMWWIAWLSLGRGRRSSPWYAWGVTAMISWLWFRDWLTTGFWLSSLALLGLHFSRIISPSGNNNRLLTNSEKRMGSAIKLWVSGALVFACVAGFLWWKFASVEPLGILTTWLLEPFIPVYLGLSAILEVVAWESWRWLGQAELESLLEVVQTQLFTCIWWLLQAVRTLNAVSLGSLSWLVFMISGVAVLTALRQWWHRQRVWYQWRRVVCP